MGFTLDPAKVRGDLFTDTGKWKHTVVLDYEGGNYHSPYLASEARDALFRATRQGISGVTLEVIPSGWFLVVLEPYTEFSFPIMVVGEG